VRTRRERARVVIFEADTPGGRAFDAVLLALIVASVLFVMVESVPGFRADHAGTLQALECVVTLLFAGVRGTVDRHRAARPLCPQLLRHHRPARDPARQRQCPHPGREVAPQTGLGQVLAACLMIMGCSVIAVPTGIVSAEMTSARYRAAPRTCHACGHADHDPAARATVKRCGADLTAAGEPASAT